MYNRELAAFFHTHSCIRLRFHMFTHTERISLAGKSKYMVMIYSSHINYPYCHGQSSEVVMNVSSCAYFDSCDIRFGLIGMTESPNLVTENVIVRS